MLRIVIPSKNRPQQLRLLLLSIKKFFPLHLAARISIYYAYSSLRYKTGYDKLFSEQIVSLWKNEEGASCLTPKESIESISNSNYKYTLLLTDDSIFYRPCILTKEIIEKVFQNPNLLTFSLRLGLNTTNLDYATCKIVEPPIAQIDHNYGNNIILWNWQKRRAGHFGYPIGLDGTIIETVELARLTKDVERNQYRQWEGNISDYAKRFDKCQTVAFDKSCVVNIPVNQVVSDLHLKNGIFCPYSTEALNDLYLDDIVIDFNRLFNQKFSGLGVSDSFTKDSYTECDTVQREFRFPFRKHKWWDKWVGL